MAKQTRTRRSAEQWQALIDEQESSGLSASAFCERQGVRRNLFYRWRSRLASMPQENSTDLLDVSALFGTAERAWDVELELGDGLVLRIRRG